jgi:hypothetical protein
MPSVAMLADDTLLGFILLDSWRVVLAKAMMSFET